MTWDKRRYLCLTRRSRGTRENAAAPLSFIVMNKEKLKNLIESIKKNAVEYYQLTGRPLGVTGEIAEFEAAEILDLELAEVRQGGYDAQSKNVEKIQIKGRCIIDKSKKGQRLSSIKIDKEWDKVILVLLNKAYEPFEIYEASRTKIEKEIKRPGSKARNLRGSLGLSKFKSIATLIWTNNS